jgi:hypothetical protein
MTHSRTKLPFLTAILGIALAVSAFAGAPPPEKLLPDDTLLVLTVPDFAKMRGIFATSPESQYWNDPAMKPFKEKFLTKLNDEFLKPLERDLDVRLSDYTNLVQGQLTLALTQNGDSTDEPFAAMLLLDSREQSANLKTNLTKLRKKWVDSGKKIRTEKIRNNEFSVISLSSNDVPKSMTKFLSPPPAAAESKDGEAPKSGAKNDLVIGQIDSLLIVGTGTKSVEKVVAHLTGGSAPALADVPAYDVNHQALFRESPLYAWANVKTLVEIVLKNIPQKQQDPSEDPFGMMAPAKIVSALGISSIKTAAFTFQSSKDGSTVEFFLGAPEASRQGLLKILTPDAKESTPPPFTPADAVKFQRWRVDGQKAFAALEKMLNDLSPQIANGLNSAIDFINQTARDKDPGFDLRKNLIGNLGNDIISYEKPAADGGASAAGATRSLVLLGSPKPEALISAMKTVMAFAGQQAGAPTEREFLGRKIQSFPLPPMPFPGADDSKSSGPRTLSCAASGNYLAMSTDSSMLEEYLRNSDTASKPLRESAGMSSAIQKVTTPGTGMFGYENQNVTMKTTLELLRKMASSTNSAKSAVQSPLSMADPSQGMYGLARDWMDFSLLPPYDKVSKYFYFTVYALNSSADGISIKAFSPTPPGLAAAGK